jgi:hypothetical protein
MRTPICESLGIEYPIFAFSHQMAVSRHAKIDVMTPGGTLPPYAEKREKQSDIMTKVRM